MREGDEEAFVDYAETVVISLQRLARGKYNQAGKQQPLEYFPVLETCVKLEDLAYQEALREFSLSGTQGIWNHAAALDLYQEICGSMIKALEQMEAKNWVPKFAENPPLNLFYHLTGRARASLGGRPSLQEDDEPTYAKGRQKRRRRGGGDDDA